MADKFVGAVQYPFGAASVLTPAYAAAIPLTIENRLTYVQVSLTGVATVTLTADKELPIGSVVIVEATATAINNDLTFASATAKAPVVAGAAAKTKIVQLMWNGSFFVAVSSAVQIN